MGRPEEAGGGSGGLEETGRGRWRQWTTRGDRKRQVETGRGRWRQWRTRGDQKRQVETGRGRWRPEEAGDAKGNEDEMMMMMMMMMSRVMAVRETEERKIFYSEGRKPCF
ncbi:hypothetical protein EYF80_041639 [Liparis tanakae]|uniref:Uncharacterized protein n=1 Tax=Liparis tanakae TaxID=230148 RepID=A0A4Z2G3S3_9TELE|nr:hypothetical protein EYF80_041639 [Liparis tanakae]